MNISGGPKSSENLLQGRTEKERERGRERVEFGRKQTLQIKIYKLPLLSKTSALIAGTLCGSLAFSFSFFLSYLEGIALVLTYIASSLPM